MCETIEEDAGKSLKYAAMKNLHILSSRGVLYH